MHKVYLALLTLKHVYFARSQDMTGHVLGGEYTTINTYPHSVFLDIQSKINCICGGSILTQNIVLTAAHCFDDYLGRVIDTVLIKYGASSLKNSFNVRMKYYRLHDDFDPYSMYADVALVRSIFRINLGNNVKRVAIMERAPKEKLAHVAGWGLVDDDDHMPIGLKHTHQKIQSRGTCEKYLDLPKGTFCAGPIRGKGHPASGDSGGALVVHHYIQIGIVSFREDFSSLVVYTNVSYFYNWIKYNAVSTYCAKL